MVDMRFLKTVIAVILVSVFIACGDDSKPASPLDTLKAYHLAVKKKDATTMKLLLSEGSRKIHQQEAQAQNLTLDDIVLRDTLFPPDQRVFKHKNEKIEGDKATIEVENNFGGYDVIHLVREEGIWKIDKKATSDQMIQEIENTNDDFEDKINQDRENVEGSVEEQSSPDPNASPNVSPTDPDTSPSPFETPKSADGFPTPLPLPPGDPGFSPVQQ